MPLPLDDIPISRLRELFHYNPDTGILTRRRSSSSRARAGMEPGTLLDPKRRSLYRSVNVDGKGRLAHRLAFAMFHGRYPKGEIDHLNGNGLDNRIANLREVSRAKNSRNMPVFKNSSSGVTGVSWKKHAKRWVARICYEGRDIHLGYFGKKSEAKAARLAAEERYFGEVRCNEM